MEYLKQYEGTISRTYSRLLDDYLILKGYEPTKGFDEIKINNSTPIDLLPIEEWSLRLQYASQILDDSLLGLHMGQAISPKHLGILGYVISACENIEQALNKLTSYHRLVFDVIPLYRNDGDTWVELIWDNEIYNADRLIDELGITVLTAFCRSIVKQPEKIIPLFINFPFSDNGFKREYENYFGCPVFFDQSKTCYRISKDMLQIPINNFSSDVIYILEQHANSMLDHLPKTQDLITQLRQIIIKKIPNSNPNITQISKEMGMSVRNMQRFLLSMNTSFRDEINIVKFQLAIAYLQDPSIQILDIAMLLGYSEHSAFTRAFKSHTGKTPQEYRHHLNNRNSNFWRKVSS